MKRFIPVWAIQLVLGAALLALIATLAIGAVGGMARVPGEFLEELGRTVQRVAPKEGPDLENDEQIKAVIRSLPDGRLRVGSVIGEEDVVVFTITAKRSAVRAAVVPGDELRMARDRDEIELAPQGIPGLLDRLGEELRLLKERYFGR